MPRDQESARSILDDPEFGDLRKRKNFYAIQAAYTARLNNYNAHSNQPGSAAELSAEYENVLKTRRAYTVANDYHSQRSSANQNQVADAARVQSDKRGAASEKKSRDGEHGPVGAGVSTLKHPKPARKTM